MLRRVLIVVLLSWGVLAVPSLCSAGLLEHACACEISSNCSHEESCSADPCVIGKPAPEIAGSLQPLAPSPTLLAIVPAAERADTAALASRVTAGYPAFAVPPALLPGTLPLLI